MSRNKEQPKLPKLSQLDTKLYREIYTAVEEIVLPLEGAPRVYLLEAVTDIQRAAARGSRIRNESWLKPHEKDIVRHRSLYTQARRQFALDPSQIEILSEPFDQVVNSLQDYKG